MDHLLLRVHGPIASWGDIAPGTHRPTLGMPTRSAILGLIASALGIRRDEEAKHNALSSGIGIATRRESDGSVLSDYHTVQTPSRERRTIWSTRRDELTQAATVNTILSTRDHVQDAAYTVALWVRPGGTVTLDDVAAALDRPRFPPYLGRRACPTALPFGAHLVNAPTLREAFDSARFPNVDRAIIARLVRSDGRVAGERRVEFDAHPSHGYEQPSTHTQRDEVVSRARWTFGERRVFGAMHALAPGVE